MRRGGAERWPEWRREPRVQHRDKDYQFVVQIKKKEVGLLTKQQTIKLFVRGS